MKLRSISGTGKVGSVINFHILELPKVIKSRLKYFNRVNINYSIRQTVPNINYSISERELSKIILTSVYWGLLKTVFSCRQFCSHHLLSASLVCARREVVNWEFLNLALLSLMHVWHYFCCEMHTYYCYTNHSVSHFNLFFTFVII